MADTVRVPAGSDLRTEPGQTRAGMVDRDVNRIDRRKPGTSTPFRIFAPQQFTSFPG